MHELRATVCRNVSMLRVDQDEHAGWGCGDACCDRGSSNATLRDRSPSPDTCSRRWQMISGWERSHVGSWGGSGTSTSQSWAETA